MIIDIIAVYRYQKVNCPVYGKYIDLLGKGKTTIEHYSQIPFLPIEFFKTQQVLSEGHPAEEIRKFPDNNNPFFIELGRQINSVNAQSKNSHGLERLGFASHK